MVLCEPWEKGDRKKRRRNFVKNKSFLLLVASWLLRCFKRIRGKMEMGRAFSAKAEMMMMGMPEKRRVKHVLAPCKVRGISSETPMLDFRRAFHVHLVAHGLERGTRKHKPHGHMHEKDARSDEKKSCAVLACCCPLLHPQACPLYTSTKQTKPLTFTPLHPRSHRRVSTGRNHGRRSVPSSPPPLLRIMPPPGAPRPAPAARHHGLPPPPQSTQHHQQQQR